MPLFKIRGTTNCNIKNTCTAVSCCVEVGKVGRTFEFMMDIDFCNQKFTVGIEKLVEEVSLNMFEYGKSWVFLRFYFENESLYQNIENYIKVFWILWINLRTFLILYLLFQHSYYSVQFKEKKCMLIELKMQSFSLLGVRKEIVIMGVIKVWYVWQIKISITAQHSPYRNNFWTIWSSLLPTFFFPKVHHMGQCRRGGLCGDCGPGHLFWGRRQLSGQCQYLWKSETVKTNLCLGRTVLASG